MTSLFIDESGDLGFNKSSSKYFIVTGMRIDNEDDVILLSRIPKKIRERTLQKKIKKCSELKFTNSSQLIRERFLERVNKIPVKIYSIIIKKEKINERLRNQLPTLYNYFMKILLEKALIGLPGTKLTIIMDQCMSINQKENFETYVNTEFFSTFNLLPELPKIIHKNSTSDSCLQVVDFVCGAFGYKYNTLFDDRDRFAEIIRSKILIEKTDLFK